jgi:lipoprotein NlpD
MKQIILFLMVSTLLAACGTASHKAPVEDRLLRQQGQTGSTAPSSKSDDSQSSYTVKKGDTLYRIAMEKGQSYTDLITWNNLANPHDIKVGQALRVTPPDTGTSLVVNPSAVEVRPLGAAMASASSASSAVTPPSSNNKHSPRADKRPYSDATLAELQKSESSDIASAKVIATQSDKLVEKVPTPVASNEIVWAWPVEGKVANHFDGGKSKGVDIPGKSGQNVYAAAAGTVMYAGSGIRGYGNLVIIKHSNNFLSAYAHNQTILVKEKQVISKGQKIAEMGSSDSDAVKLHFEIRQQGKPVDPLKFLPGR